MNLLRRFPLNVIVYFYIAVLIIIIPLAGCSKEVAQEPEADIVEILKELYAPLDYFYKNIDHETYNSVGDSALPKKYNTREELITFFETTMSREMAEAYVDWYAYYDEDYKAYFVPAMGRPATIHDYIPTIIILEETETRIIVELHFNDDWEPYKMVNHIAKYPDNTYKLIMENE